MLTKLVIIVLSVSIFGILFFFYVKNLLKKRLDEYVLKGDKKTNKN